jgi:cell division protein FtsI (penicillin-binding protein 3)
VSRRRLWIVILGLALATVGVAARSVQVMVLQHGYWVQRARRQHERVITVPGPRGDIVTADGYVLATSVDRFAVQLDTHFLPYPELFVRAASPILEVSEDDLRRRIVHGPRTMWMVQRATRDTVEAIRSLAPDAVVLVPDAQRLYPMGRLASPVVGFVGREELQTIGRAGFEHHYDALLAGEPETYLTVNDAVQRRLRLERVRTGHAGYDIELTLHARLQAVCEEELARVIREQRARAASAIVMETHTGTLLAVASLPSFDPASPGEVDSKFWRLRPVQDAYEPGSLVKPMVAAVGLSESVVTSGERFDCRAGGTTVAGHWIRDHAERGVYSLDEVVAASANMGIIEVAQRLSPDSLWRAFDAFGFGRRTGVGFPAETSGILPPTRSWSKMSQASLAIGQELTASPLQIAVAYAAIANGGWLLRPRLVARVTDERQSLDGGTQWRSRVLSPELCRRLRSMLEDVVTDGTGEGARVRGYRVAGKTGTAQLATNGAFDDIHHVAWFAGFFPQPEPRIVVVVAVEDPAAEIWGSTVAAPVFARIAQATLIQIGLPPSEPMTDPEPGGSV